MPTPLELEEVSAESSKSQRVYDYLRQRIRNLQIPPGTPLRKNEIALECGVSRAPVSEAIARLASEGLVDVFPQNGSFVSPIRPEDIRECMFIRMSLEVEAVKRATEQADKALLERLRQNIQAQADALDEKVLDADKYDNLDAALHAEIMAAIDSPRSQHMLESARVVLDRPRFLTLPEHHKPEETLNEHRRIVDGISTGDPELAGAAMRVHLSNVTRIIEAKMARFENENVPQP